MKKALRYFLLCNSIAFLIQIFFMVLQSHFFVTTLALPKHVYWEIIYTLYIQFFGCILLSLFQIILEYATQDRWLKTSPKIRQRIFFFASWATLIALNIHYFPLSQYSRFLFSFLPEKSIACCGLIAASILVYATALSCIQWFKNFPLPMVVIGLCLIKGMPSPTPMPYHEKTDQPHLIIIGIDSLSPSFVDVKNMPTLWQFLHENVWFPETISPLARTYPAWSTILSGLHPVHHQARYNLINTNSPSGKSIVWQMKQKNYTTLFATDDRRFNLLDESFGFQKIIGPQIGVNDMLLGTFNDFLLGNLFINTRIGKWFFPYNYMNRASYFSYYPQTFDHALAQAITESPSTQPIFMAIHFTLPHWPYAYAPTRSSAAYQEYNLMDRIPLYQEALQATDKQIRLLLELLKKNHLLDHTLLIILSDHGETLYTPLSRPIALTKYQATQESQFEAYLKKNTSTALDKSAGHGSDLLSPEQFHCIFALQYYREGLAQYPSQNIMERVALQDIAPTLLDYTHQSFSSLDGISLRPRIEQKEKLPERAFILESGMLPNQFLSREKARLAGKKFFEVDPQTALLHLRQDKLHELDRDKLYAILKKDWILALYPTSGKYIPVLQQIKTQAWTDQLDSAFALQSPAKSLLKELRLFYNTQDFRIS